MEFRKPSITSIITARREARGNGSDVQASLHAVPAAVEHMALAAALAQINTIEQSLEAAREVARGAARRAGVSLSCLFEGTSFIARSTGHRWRDEALEQGKDQRVREITRALQASANPDPKFAGARAWAAQMLRQRRAAGFADDVQLTSEQQTALINGTLTAADPGAAEDAAEAEAAAKIMAEAKVRADAILAAARLRDAGGRPLPAPTGRAKAILDAAREAHRKVGDDE
jgi:hypothetical protein